MYGEQAIPRLTHTPSLDGLRGVAIALVLATHTTSVFGDPFGGLMGHLLHFGHTGVDLFFVLSGFLITCILLDTRGCKGYLLSFFARRGLRIWPLYFVVMVGIIGVFGPTVLQGRVEDWDLWQSGWPWNLTFTTNFFLVRAGDWVCAITDITWSVCIEEQFYILWPFVVLALGRRWLPVAAVIMVLGAVVSRVYVCTISEHPWFTAYMLPWCRMDSLAVGAFIASAIGPPSPTADASRWSRVQLFAITSAIGGVVLVGVATLLRGNAYVTLSFTGYAIGYGLLLSGVLYGRLQWLEEVMTSRPLRFLGRISYGVYLLHLIIGYATKAVISPLEGRPMLFYSVGSAVMIVGSIGLATCSWHYFESRVLRLNQYVPRPESITSARGTGGGHQNGAIQPVEDAPRLAATALPVVAAESK